MNIKGIIGNISKMVGMGKAKTVATTTTGQIVDMPMGGAEYAQMVQNNSRLAVITDCRTMYNERGQVFSIIQTISAYLTKGGYTIVVKPKEEKLTAEEQKAQDILNQVNERLRLERTLQGWMIPLVRDGVLPIEIEVAGNQIIRATKLAAELTHQRIDKNGRSYELGGEVAADNAYYHGSKYGGQETCKFADWQIMWIEWNSIQCEGGSPQFSSVRRLYKRIENAEINQGVLRTTKSGYRLHHKIGTSDNPGKPEDVQEYKKMNRAVITNQLAPIKDFFSNGLVDIKEISGDTKPINMEDIKYQQSQLFGAGGVPLAIIPGQESSIIRDSSNESIKGFISWIQTCNKMIGAELKQSIFDLELLLNGINPESIDYNIIWGVKIEDNKLVEKAEIRAAKKDGLISIETAMREYGIKDTDIEIERIKKDMANFPTVPVAQTMGYSVGDNPLGLVGSLKVGQGLRESRRLEHESRLQYITALNEILTKAKK